MEAATGKLCCNSHVGHAGHPRTNIPTVCGQSNETLGSKTVIKQNKPQATEHMMSLSIPCIPSPLPHLTLSHFFIIP